MDQEIILDARKEMMSVNFHREEIMILRIGEIKLFLRRENSPPSLQKEESAPF